MSEQWMSIVEYARTFAISDMTVRRRIKNGKLNAVLRDGKYYIQIDSNRLPSDSHPQIEPKASVSLPPPPKPSPSFGVEKGGAVLSPRGWHKDQREDVLGKHTALSQDDLFDLRGLVDYCNRSLNRIASIERHLNETYQNKLARLEAELRAKNIENTQLKQRVEDLQILIKMYDKGPS